MQVQCAAVNAQQNEGMDHDGVAGQRQGGAIQWFAAAQQWPRQAGGGGEIEHDGKQGEEGDGHDAGV